MMLLETIVLSLACAQGYDHGDSNSDEQMVLEVINRARANPTGPTGEDNRLNILPDISEGIPAGAVANVGPRPPLAWNKILLNIARAHARDMYFRNYFGHTDPDGLDPGERMDAAGYQWSNMAENIAGGPLGSANSPTQLEDLLMIDSGVTDRGHRTNLLDFYDVSVNPAPPYRREIGIGWFAAAGNNSDNMQALMCQDFGRQLSASVGPFLVGVVYIDKNSNLFYDVGEGVPQVTITITSGGLPVNTTTTAPGGGFSIPIPSTASGNITVQASGGPLTTTLSQVIALTGENIRAEFKPTLAQILDTDGDGIPDFYEKSHGMDPLKFDSGNDLDGDGFTNLQEYQRGSNPQAAGSTPNTANGMDPAPILPPGSSGGGACGSTGIDLLWPLALLMGLRRRYRNA